MGIHVGRQLGSSVGELKGAIDGNGEGLQVGINVGAKFGFIVGSVRGCCDGNSVG